MTQHQLKNLMKQSGITLKVDGSYSGDLDNFVRLLVAHTDYLDQLDADTQDNWPAGMN